MTHPYPPNLSQQEAEKRLSQYGRNILPERNPPNIALIFLHQFKSPFIYVLLGAAVFSYALDQKINAFFIFVVLLLSW